MEDTINIKKYVGNKIKFYRKEKHLTQKDLGIKIGVKDNTISGYENGISDAGQNVLFAIAEVLGVSVNDFFPPTTIDSPSAFSPMETDLLSDYRKLNNDGQAIANNTVKGLTMVPQYTEKEKPLNIFERPDIAMAASGLTPTTELSEHNQNVIAKHYNKDKR